MKLLLKNLKTSAFFNGGWNWSLFFLLLCHYFCRPNTITWSICCCCCCRHSLINVFIGQKICEGTDSDMAGKGGWRDRRNGRVKEIAPQYNRLINLLQINVNLFKKIKRNKKQEKCFMLSKVFCSFFSLWKFRWQVLLCRTILVDGCKLKAEQDKRRWKIGIIIIILIIIIIIIIK